MTAETRGAGRSIGRALLGALLLLAALSGRGRAASLPDPDTRVVPCRPTITCTPDLARPGLFEIELGFITRRLGSGDFQYATPLLLKLTLVEWFQLQLGTSGGVFVPTGPSATRYLDNLTVGGKFHLRDQSDAGPATALSAAISVPTYAGQGAYAPIASAQLILHLGKDFAWLRADANAGVSVLRMNGAPLLQGFASLALSVSLPRGFGLMLEGYGFTDAGSVASRDAGLLLAVCFAAKPWLMLDLGADAGLFQSSRSFSLFTGMVLIPVKLWEPIRPRPAARTADPARG